MCSSEDEANMVVSDKDITVFPEWCLSPSCLHNCEKEVSLKDLAIYALTVALALDYMLIRIKSLRRGNVLVYHILSDTVSGCKQ